LTALENASEGLSVGEIQAAARVRTRNAADLLLSKMAGAGEIKRVKRGIYSLPRFIGQIRQNGQKDIQPPESEQESGNLSVLSDLSGDCEARKLAGEKSQFASARSPETWPDLEIPEFLKRQ
jgi:hypothetical protein